MAKPTEGEGEVGGLEDRLKAENRRRRSQLVVPALRAEAAGVEGRAASEGETCNLGSRWLPRLSVGTFQNTLGTSCCKPEVEILE